MELEGIEVDVLDDTRTVIPTPVSVESGSTENNPSQPVNTGCPAVVGDGAGDGAGAAAATAAGDGGQGAGDGDGDGSGLSENGQYQKRERQKTSKIWNDFVSVTIGGVKKSQCNWCKRLFAVGKSSTTSTLNRHLTSCVRYVEFSSSKKQSTLSFEPSSENDVVGSLTSFSYKESRVRELASHMVLLHEYPFNMMEHELFNKFMRACTPHWKKISRATVRNDCITTYQNEKRKLRTLLKLVDKVNITTDMWTSCQRVSYMVVTCHFVDSTWCLQKRILNFCNVPPPHSGVVIADALRDCFSDWGIEDKIHTITVDNASANDSAIRIIKDDFELKNALLVGGRLFHVRCCAHITNLLVQSGLAEIRGIIDDVRQGIKYIVASESRLNVFSEIAKRLHLPCKKLILDVPTRWNSTYLMLDTAIKFKEVFPRYHRVEQAFQWVVTPEQWEMVGNVNQVLSVFNDVTNVVSGSEYPTANLYLLEVWRMKEVLMIKCDDRNEYMRSMASRMIDKFDKYWGDSNLLMSIAAVLDPRYKMKLINFCFPIIYPLTEACSHIKNVLAVLKELFEAYVSAHTACILQETAQLAQVNVPSCSSSSAIVGDVVSQISEGRSRFADHIRSSDIIRPIKTDLDVYLEEDVYICGRNENGVYMETNFDALAWWKCNALKYRILSRMAKDILAVPISTVASESSFSAGGRVIEPHRASLSPDTVQMLLCGSDWVRALHGIKRKSASDKLVEVELPTTTTSTT
ncbi:zinc finger BED domain-containing protein RICESLEEPER 2-like [Corylus avellana]|uniref:zinc finger BED domain-containing protein RICESLEEPER 2-like n=1 Tax=Corylus avellana TaxID=13451 RepID=UPI00286BB45D|nr:zinc finger BED domain-containing protein RICESLEEPER 2-like [Corylus avellana]